MAVLLSTTIVAIVLAVLLPFETKGKELAEGDEDLDETAENVHNGTEATTNGLHEARDSVPPLAGKGALEMTGVRTATNPFHSDEVSTQLPSARGHSSNEVNTGSLQTDSDGRSGAAGAFDTVAVTTASVHSKG